MVNSFVLEGYADGQAVKSALDSGVQGLARADSLREYPNLLRVGDGMPYTTIQSAIDVVKANGDAAADNRYHILVYPGVYQDGFNASALTYTTISGFGNASIIEVEGTTGSQILCSSMENCVIDGFKIICTRTTPSSSNYGALRAAFFRDNEIRNCRFEVTITGGSRASLNALTFAIHITGALGERGLRIEDCEIVTNSCGIGINSGQADIYATNIWLIGEETPVHDLDQYGLVVSTSSRIRVHGGRITCGYNYRNPNRDNTNIVCVYLPGYGDNATNPQEPLGWTSHRIGKTTEDGARVFEAADNCRVFLNNVEAFARNESTSPGVTRVVLAENGWVRVLGGMYQAEVPENYLDASAFESWYTTDHEDASGLGGLLEVSPGSRVSSYVGGVAAISCVAPLVITSNFSGEKFYGSVVVADTSGGAITFTLPSGKAEGHLLQFTVLGGSDLTVQATNTATIDGGAAAGSITVASGAQKRLIQYEEDKWVSV